MVCPQTLAVWCFRYFYVMIIQRNMAGYPVNVYSATSHTDVFNFSQFSKTWTLSGFWNSWKAQNRRQRQLCATWILKKSEFLWGYWIPVSLSSVSDLHTYKCPIYMQLIYISRRLLGNQVVNYYVIESPYKIPEASLSKPCAQPYLCGNQKTKISDETTDRYHGYVWV